MIENIPTDSLPRHNCDEYDYHHHRHQHHQHAFLCMQVVAILSRSAHSKPWQHVQQAWCLRSTLVPMLPVDFLAGRSCAAAGDQHAI